MDYFWLKFIHYLAFISWMAMLFYLPRLFVYHAENLNNADFVKVVKIQERKLYNGIGWIAMGASIASGLAIFFIYKPELIQMGYFHIKLLCAVLLVAYHFSLGYYLRLFAKDQCQKSGKFFRAYNEIPTLIMAFIVYAMIVNANS